MENTLYVVSNFNLDTTKLVASCLSKRYKDGFRRIVFFESRESEKDEYEQIEIYRSFFHDFEKKVIMLNEDGSIPSQQLYTALEVEGNRVIDLSNGPKITTSSLYLAASLCRLEDVYCLMLHTKPTSNMIEGRDYDYLKLRQMEGIERLAKISYFDLIYYYEDIKTIFSPEAVKQSDRLHKIYIGVKNGIRGFFTDLFDVKSVILNLTIGNETIVDTMLKYLRQNQEAVAFARRNSINLYYNGDPIGIISRFFKEYSKSGSNQNLICLCTVPGLLSGLRAYRNIAAHYSRNHVILTDDNARTVINMQIEVIKCIHMNQELWGNL